MCIILSIIRRGSVVSKFLSHDCEKESHFFASMGQEDLSSSAFGFLRVLRRNDRRHESNLVIAAAGMHSKRLRVYVPCYR